MLFIIPDFLTPKIHYSFSFKPRYSLFIIQLPPPSMAVYGYVGLCRAVYGYIWVCRAIYGYVWLCCHVRLYDAYTTYLPPIKYR